MFFFSLMVEGTESLRAEFYLADGAFVALVRKAQFESSARRRAASHDWGIKLPTWRIAVRVKMQPLTRPLAGATCSELVVRRGTCSGESTKNLGGVRSLPALCSCSRTGLVGWNSQGALRRTSGGSHAVVVPFPSKWRSLKAGAAVEDEPTVDLLTLEAEAKPESEVDQQQEAVIEEENNAPKEETGPKANVKFVLQKECHFGQQFNVVGEIPELGEWDPSQAVTMEWSEGHVWSAEVPIPVGLTVKYKFVMTGKRLELEWQPGEDKVFETKDMSDITVSGIWDDSELVADGPVTSGELEDAVGDTEEAPSTNGLATASADSDLQEAALVAEAVADEVIAAEERLDSSDLSDAVSDNESEQEEEPQEKLEIPVVDAALATAVAEVSGEVEDAAAANEI